MTPSYCSSSKSRDLSGRHQNRGLRWRSAPILAQKAGAMGVHLALTNHTPDSARDAVSKVRSAILMFALKAGAIR